MLPSETVLAIFEDHNRRMWIGTQNGLVRLEATSVQVVPLPNGTEADYGTISEAGNSTSWMVVGNLFRVSAHNAERVVESGLPKDGLRNVFQARDGGNRFLPPPVKRALSMRSPDSELSAREREVLRLMVAGRSNREIGDELNIKEATVKSHVSVILMRLQVTDRTQAVVEALKRGLEHL